MNREEKLLRTADVSARWIEKYADTPGFDPDNPTREQSDEEFRMLRDEFGTVGEGEFAEAISKMSEAELAELRKLSIYQETSIPGL